MVGSPYVQAIGGSYHLEDKTAAIQDAINCYPKKLDGSNWMQESVPGEETLAELTYEGRGFRDVNGRFFGVFGNTLYELTESTQTSRGTLLTSSGDVSMAHNASQLAIVDGDNFYIFTLATNTLTQITVAGWLGSDNVVFIDGYFIFVDPTTEQFYLSAIDDGTSLDALDFSSADTQPDNILCHKVSHQQVWFFGKDSTEIWINSGGAAFPFLRYTSYALDVGIVGTRAAINAADTLFWVGRSPRGSFTVYMATGNQPQRVSTVAVERALKASTDISAVTMWAYQSEGSEFVGIDAPGLDTTWVYDAANQMWHEEAEWDAEWLPKRARLITAFEGNHYAADSDGNFIKLNADLNQFSGRTLKRQRTWPHMISPSMEPVSYLGLEIMAKSGYTGLINLQISNDGGNTFSSPIQRTLGVIGRWVQRIRWNGLGTASRRVFRLWQTDNVPFGLYSATIMT